MDTNLNHFIKTVLFTTYSGMYVYRDRTGPIHPCVSTPPLSIPLPSLLLCPRRYFETRTFWPQEGPVALSKGEEPLLDAHVEGVSIAEVGEC
jgi:hypothetical protein